ncbi:MAG: GNAT family N-acetyltransferase [Gemmatimonadota bacterium]|nr:GNAT family N-acetyltransferase [Gemmatimonadota bacterium]
MVLNGMVNQERNLTIRDAGQDEEFSAWLSELVERHPSGATMSAPRIGHHLVLSDEIGDWIGGARFWVHGGVAHLEDLGVVPHERHQGHGLRLLGAFEARAVEEGAHLLEFWTDDLRAEGLLAALGWSRTLQRPDYIGRRPWHLFEKRFPTSP